MKVAVVGGGSTYTPELVDGIARLQHLSGVDELVLTDPAEERLSLVTGISREDLRQVRAIPGGSCPPPILTVPCQMPQSFSSS